MFQEEQLIIPRGGIVRCARTRSDNARRFARDSKLEMARARARLSVPRDDICNYIIDNIDGRVIYRALCERAACAQPRYKKLFGADEAGA